MINYTIRAIKPTEVVILKEFLYEAIFQRDEENLVPKDVILKPEMKAFYEEFGKKKGK